MTETSLRYTQDELGPSSLLLSLFFDWLGQERVIYAVMNNYEGLPRIIPSDVDFSVEERVFVALDRHIVEFAQLNGATLVQKLWHGDHKCAYIIATGPKGTREFIQLDFFTDFSTKGCPRLITHEDLVDGRRALRGFFVPRPEIELIFTVMRRLFKNDWSPRHCKRIAELSALIEGHNYLPARYVWLNDTISLACDGDVRNLARRRLDDWQRLKRVARDEMSLGERLGNFITQARRIFFRLRNETGNLSVAHGCRHLTENEGFKSLEMVFHRKLVIDADWMEDHKGQSIVQLILRLTMLKRRKGLVLIELENAGPRVPRLVSWLDRLGLIDQSFVYANATGDWSCRDQTVQVQGTSDLIEAIVKNQSTKTVKAIERGGSQTSR